MFENHRRGRQARNFTINVSKILDLKWSSEQIFFRKLSLGAPDGFVPVHKLSGINSNVDIKAKPTPSAGQVESDAVTALRANESEFMSFGHSIPIYSHFKTTSRHLRDCSMLVRMLTMWSCFLPHLAGWFLVLLRLDVSMTCWSWSKSQFVVGLYHLCAFVVPRPFPSLEKRDKPSLTYISLKNSLRFAFPLEIWCLSQNERLLIVSKRKVACNFFKSRRLRCETLATFAFAFILHFFALL